MVNVRITLAGDPAAKQLAGIEPVTTEPAATTELSPMLAPASTMELAPIQTLLPIDTCAWRTGASGET